MSNPAINSIQSISTSSNLDYLLHQYSTFLAAMDLQTLAKAPRSLRTLFRVWIAMTFLLLASYECNLRANLVVVEYEKPVDTEQDILDRNLELHVSKVTIYRLYKPESY